MEKAVEVINQIFTATSKELGLLGTGLRLEIINNPFDLAGGSFTVDGFGPLVTVNMKNLRTKRDAIFVTAHEVRHAYQYEQLGIFGFMLYGVKSSSALAQGKFVDYFFSEVEYDANRWALGYEDKMDYNNEVWNSCAVSNFIDTKIQMNKKSFDAYKTTAEARVKEMFA